MHPDWEAADEIRKACPNADHMDVYEVKEAWR